MLTTRGDSRAAREACTPISPLLGLHWASLAKLEQYGGDNHSALEAVETATRLLRVTHSGRSGTTVMAQLRQTEQEAQIEAYQKQRKALADE